MLILGISSFYHDSGACLIEDGKIKNGNQFCELPIENNYSENFKDFVGHPSISSSKVIGDLIYEKISTNNKLIDR